MYKLLLLPLLFCLSFLPAQAQSNNSILESLISNQPQFLPADQAFQFDFRQQEHELLLSWTIADGYYLYRDKIKLGGIAVSFSHPVYPASIQIEDEFFGVTDVYYHQLRLSIPLSDIGPDAVLKVQYIGCAEAGLCYQPATKDIPLLQLATPANPGNQAATAIGAVSSQTELAEKLEHGINPATLGLFFLLGLGLAFTPCVFPMYPILSSIIVGQGQQLRTRRAFSLSFSYVQGMALTYSAVGLLVASLGLQFQASLQHPAILITASLLFVVLALAMFGAFNFSLPAGWQQKITGISNQQQGGSLKSAFVMGALSGLIASPCTTAPLSGALLYVAQSGDLLTGALTLYILSLGMGLPLILLGSSGGRFLPAAGQWMQVIKTLFGFLLLSVPLVLLERMLPMPFIVVCGSLLLLALVFYLYLAINDLKKPAARAIIMVFGQLLLIAGVWFNAQYWWPNSATAPSQPHAVTGRFIEVADLTELQQQIAAANAAGRFVMVDLYADWCIACKEFEQLTFPKPEVQHYTQQMTLLKVDVTRMTRSNQQLLDQYQVLGLPTLLFFNTDGQELTQSRVTGFMNAGNFATHLSQLLP